MRVLENIKHDYGGDRPTKVIQMTRALAADGAIPIMRLLIGLR